MHGGEPAMLNTGKNNAKKVAVLTLVLCGLWVPLLQAQEKPAIVVQPFTTANGVSWPYDMQRMTSQTLAELQTKDGKKYEISTAAPLSRAHYYSLNGEVLAWHPGNRAKRMLVGVGTGRETATIRYWLADETGKKVFEHDDPNPPPLSRNEYAASFRRLAPPFAHQIA